MRCSFKFTSFTSSSSSWVLANQSSLTIAPRLGLRRMSLWLILCCRTCCIACSDATSVSNSISTEALDSLLAHIDETKRKLDAAGKEKDGVEKQEKIAGLLQALSTAAAQMEILDDRSSASSELLDTVSRASSTNARATRRYYDV